MEGDATFSPPARGAQNSNLSKPPPIKGRWVLRSSSNRSLPRGGDSLRELRLFFSLPCAKGGGTALP